MDKEIKQDIKKILIQTTKTNGSVIELNKFKDKAEKKLDILEDKSAELKGGIDMTRWIFGIIIAIALACGGYFFNVSVKDIVREENRALIKEIENVVGNIDISLIYED